MANPLGINGGPKKRVLADALRRELYADDRAKLRELVTVVVGLALAGEQWAAQLVFDRIDGRVPLPLAGADGESPAKLQIEWKVSSDNGLEAAQLVELPAPGNGLHAAGRKPSAQVIELTPEKRRDQPPV